MPENLETFLNYPLLKFSDGSLLTPGQITVALIVLILGLFLARLAARITERNLQRTHIGADAARTIHKLLYYALTLVVLLTALKLLNIPVTALTFASGAVALGVGFGAQNIVNNFISGWILISERPVRIGDFVEVEGSKGVIDDIGNRCTRIRRVDGVHLLVPNSQMLERTVVNWTLVDKDIRTTLRVGVAYGSPVRKVESLILQAVSEHPHIKQTPAPLVIFEDFGDSALIFDAYFWCEVLGERELRQIRSDLRYRISELFQEAGITIAFPQQDVHLDSLTPIQVHLTRTPADRPQTQEDG